MCQNTITRCARCMVILTHEELSAEHMYPDHQVERPTCIACSSDVKQCIMRLLTFASIHAPNAHAASSEWVRRVRMSA